MDDGVDPVECAAERVAVADVADDELDVLVEIVGALAGRVDLRVEAVERANLVAAREQPVREVRADEPRAACDQHLHGRA